MAAVEVRIAAATIIVMEDWNWTGYTARGLRDHLEDFFCLTQIEGLANDGQPGLLAAWKNPSFETKTGSFCPALLECMASAYTRPTFPRWMPIEHESAEPLRRYLQGSLEAEPTRAELEQIRAWHVR